MSSRVFPHILVPALPCPKFFLPSSLSGGAALLIVISGGASAPAFSVPLLMFSGSYLNLHQSFIGSPNCVCGT